MPKTEGTVTQAPGAAPQPSSGGGKWWVAAVVVALLAAGGVYFVRQCGDDRTPSVATAGQNDSVVVDSVPAAASPSGGEAAASEGAGKAAPAANGNAETTAAPAGENIECPGRWRDPLRRSCAGDLGLHSACLRSCADQGCFRIERSRISVEHVHLCADHGSHARTGAHGQCGTNRP